MSITVEKWDFFDLTLRASVTGNPFLEVTLTADFTHWNGKQKVRVHGFYDGDDVFKLRFMPDEEGGWTYVTHSSVPELDGKRGELMCTAPSSGNHGPVRVAGTIHFAYADGTPYVPVGTTCYVWNLQGDALEVRTLKTLKQAPFNKMRMCVFPKRYRFNHNEPPLYPFAGEVTKAWDPAQLDNLRAEPPDFWDFSQFNPAYFRHLEQRILDLRERGIEADLILFHPYDFSAWGFDHMPAEVNLRYLRYVVARLSAFRNLWWSFANEFDLLLDRTTADWDRYFQLVKELDPYDHLRSVHNCHGFYDHSKPWVTHCSVQHHNLNLMPGWIQKYNKPVVVDECGYEGDIYMIWGDLAAEELIHRFWLGFTCGGYVGHGETYLNDEELMWWSKGGELHGKSAARIAFLRQIFEEVPAPGLLPLPKADAGLIDGAQAAAALVDAKLYDGQDEAGKIIPEGAWNIEAAGYAGDQTFLFYFGMHQPRLRYFNLPEGPYRIDVIDAWNMTIETALRNASGQVCVDLPARKYMAIRIEKENA